MSNPDRIKLDLRCRCARKDGNVSRKRRPCVLNVAILALVFAACAAPSQSTEIEHLRSAAEQGGAEAQYELGCRYRWGRGVPEDDAEAARWLRLAAEQGHAKAQIEMALSYSQDDAEAVRWARLAADQGDAEAQYKLGYRYAMGWGVAKDESEAVRWYRLAAEQGYATAQYNLGLMYDNGQGVPQDYVQAHKWINLAASRTTGEAEDFRSMRDEVAEKMTASQVAEAQRLAREWQPKTWEN